MIQNGWNDQVVALVISVHHHMQSFETWESLGRECRTIKEEIQYLERRHSERDKQRQETRYDMIARFLSECRQNGNCVISPDGKTKLLVKLRARQHMFSNHPKTAWFHWPVKSLSEDLYYKNSNWRKFMFTVQFNDYKSQEIVTVLSCKKNRVSSPLTFEVDKPSEQFADDIAFEHNMFQIITTWYKTQQTMIQTLDAMGLFLTLVRVVMSFVSFPTVF